MNQVKSALVMFADDLEETVSKTKVSTTCCCAGGGRKTTDNES